MIQETAPAKINLSLHVLGRRADGYHDLKSLVAFATIGDDVHLLRRQPLALQISGPMADQVGDGPDNLVLRAAAAFEARYPNAKSGSFHLIKRLPVAGGIGGGSADAAAALRLLAQANDIAQDEPALMEIARTLGADVPVCLNPVSHVMSGIGDRLSPAPNVEAMPAVLVNPGVPLPTLAVFAELGLKPGEKFREERDGTPPIGENDLEAPAVRLAPVVADVLAALRSQADCRIAGMSGSGSTCFALFEHIPAAISTAARLSQRHPEWWIQATTIG